LTKAILKWCCGGHFFLAFPIILDSFSVYKTPNIIAETIKLFLNLNKLLSIIDRRTYFQLISNNSGIIEQYLNLLFIETCHLFYIKMGKSLTVSFSFFEDGTPT